MVVNSRLLGVKDRGDAQVKRITLRSNAPGSKKFLRDSSSSFLPESSVQQIVSILLTLEQVRPSVTIAG